MLSVFPGRSSGRGRKTKQCILSTENCLLYLLWQWVIDVCEIGLFDSEQSGVKEGSQNQQCVLTWAGRGSHEVIITEAQPGGRSVRVKDCIGVQL